MKVLVLKSNLTQLPLAEIRSDSRSIEILVDNTGGQLTAEVGSSYAKLLEYVDQSSHLYLEEPQEPTTHLLRYVLTNGDVVEITTDGRTALINGKLITEEQKQALFGAIRDGHVSVSVKADPSKPVPVMPTPKKDAPVEQPDLAAQRKDFQTVLAGRQKKLEMANKGSAQYDPEIESADYRDVDDVATLKNLWYSLKYGSGK